MAISMTQAGCIPVHETSDMSRDHKQLNLFNSHPVASLRNLQNRQRYSAIRFSGLVLMIPKSHIASHGDKKEKGGAETLIDKR